MTDTVISPATREVIIRFERRFAIDRERVNS
jgi:hypothetical protein